MPTPQDILGTATLAATRVLTVNEPVSTNIFFEESITSLTASATLTGLTRDVGAVAGLAHKVAAFNAFAFASVAGTLRIEVSNDNTTWRRITADTAVAAGAAIILSVPVVARYHRAVFVNGAAAQTAFMANTSFTMA